MLPVSVGLGLININLLLNSAIGSLVSDQVPRAIDAAFRIYMLPQGMFSVAVATVLFPQLARLAARGDYAGMRATIGVGLRQIAPAADPRRRGDARARRADRAARATSAASGTPESTALTADALFWFAFSLPFSGFVLMLTRGFFSLQRPWVPTTLAVGSLAINAIGSYLLAKPFGIAGIVIGTIAVQRRARDRRGDLAAARARRVRDARDAGRDREDARRRGASWRPSRYGVWCGLDDAARATR